MVELPPSFTFDSRTAQGSSRAGKPRQMKNSSLTRDELDDRMPALFGQQTVNEGARFMATLTTIVGVLGSVAVAGLSINSTIVDRTLAATAPEPVVAVPAAKARVVRVTGEDFKFDAPDVIPAG